MRKRELVTAGIAIAIVAMSLYAVAAACSSSAYHWSPRAQAEATIMLRETPLPTENPETVAAREVAEQKAIKTVGDWSVGVIVAVSLGIMSIAVAASGLVLSFMTRHVKATVSLAPSASLPAGQHVLLSDGQGGNGIYNKATGEWKLVSEGDKPGNLDQLLIEKQAEIGKVAAVAEAIAGGKPNRGHLAQAKFLLEQGDVDGQD